MASGCYVCTLKLIIARYGMKYYYDNLDHEMLNSVPDFFVFVFNDEYYRRSPGEEVDTGGV